MRRLFRERRQRERCQHHGDVVHASGVERELHEFGRGAERVGERGRERELGQARCLGPVIPQSVRAHEHDTGAWRLEPDDVRLKVGQVGAEPAGDHMRLRGGQGLRLAHRPPGDQLLGQRVIRTQAYRVRARAEPVGAAVPQPAHRDRTAVDDRRYVRSRRCLARRADPGQGLVGDLHRGQRGFRRVIAAPDRGEQRPHRRLRGGQRGVVRPRRRGHAVADHGYRHRAAGGIGRGQGHRVLVARMPQAAVGHPGQQAEVEFGMVTTGRHLAAARLAVTLRRDHAGRDLRVHGAHRALRQVARWCGAHHGRSQLGPA